MKKFFLTSLILFFFLTSLVAASEFSADMVMDMPMGKQTGKLYHKDQDTSRTEMMGMITIMKYPKVYQLFSDTRKYFVTDIDELSKEHPGANIRDFDQFIREHNFKKIGSDTLQGYRCDIFEGEIEFRSEPGESPTPIFMKLWYSKDLDYALKTESTLPPPMGGKVVSRLENITKGRQAATLFEIPSGYTRAESMHEAMGLPSMPGMPGQMPSAGEAPSSEEMDAILKMMQEMMEQQSP